MEKIRNLLPVALVVGLLVAGSSLQAQSREDSPSEPTGDVGGPSAKDAQLSPDEMESRVRALTAQGENHRARVEQLKAEARKNKDVIKLNCINDKLLQVKQLLNIMDDSASRLSVAISTGEESERIHRFSVVSISAEKVSTLREEAEACIGEEISYLGPTNIDVDEPDVPDDPTVNDPFDDDVVEPPGYASPIM